MRRLAGAVSRGSSGSTRFGAIIGRALQAESRITLGDLLRVTAILTLAVVVMLGAAQWAFDADEFPTLFG